MTMVERLIWLAEKLADEGAHSLTIKRRAVSTAYYGVFHALTQLCAEEFLGSDRATKASPEYEHAYRALDHGSLKSAFNKAPLKDNARLRKIGNLVVVLQSERIRSDYLPTRRLYTKLECRNLVDSAKATVKLIDQLPQEDRRMLAVYLVLGKNR